MTPEFLELLARLDVPATFFLCGRNVERLPELAGDIVRAGHAVGNHTQSHRALMWAPKSLVYKEVARAQKAIEKATGVTPRQFRPPYGIPSPWLPGALQEHALQNVLWTVIGNDWKAKAREISDRVLRAAKPGNIVCLHDGRETHAHADRRETLRALETIVPSLKADGYEFVRVADIGQSESQ